MKIRIIKARGTFTAGQELEVKAEDAIPLISEGYAVDAIMAKQIDDMRAQQWGSMEAAVKASITRAKTRGAIPPKDEAVQTEAINRLTKFKDATAEQQTQALDMVVQTVDGLKSEGVVTAQQRLTKPYMDDGSMQVSTVMAGNVTMHEATDGYCKAREPITKLIQTGKIAEAMECSRESSGIMSQHILKIIRAGGDFSLRDAVRAGDYTDPNSQVGTLATGLLLMRNLGFLKNKLNWLDKFTTDLRNEAINFGQIVNTRYLTPPGVLTWVPGVGFTSDATAIAAAGTGTNQSGGTTQSSGTVTKSVPSSTDVNVTMNQFKAVEIEFPISTLAATVRNLFAEQRGAQTYALAEHINQYVLSKIFGATWTGIVKRMVLGNNFGLPTMATLKNRMELAKIPDMGRFALLHSTFHDNLLADGNLLTAKAILALINKDDSSYNGGDVPELFGIKPLGSQLASYAGGTATAPTIDANSGDIAFTGVDSVGFAGNQSSMVFCARVPQDFTTAASKLGIPASAAVEIITDPDSQLSLMIFKYVDNGKMSISVRMCLMYGAAQGDPRVGIVLAPM